MITYFLRILSLACSLLPFQLRRWGLAFVSALRSLRYILMRTWLVFACCFLSLLSWSLTSEISTAHGQTPVPTETPTPTSEPMFHSSTQTSTLPAVCLDSGLPSGWGTITPSWNWSLNCGKCVVPATPTPGPGSIYYKSPTPGPTITPSPTAVSIALTGKIDGNAILEKVPWTVNKAPIDWGSGTAVTWQFDGGAGVGTRKVGLEYLVDYYMTYESGGWQNDIYLDIFNTGPSLVTVEFLSGWRAGQVQTINSGGHYNVMVWHQQATTKVEIRDRFNISWSGDVTNYDVQVKYYAYSAYSNGNTKIQGNTTWYKNGYVMPTPTPGVSYCNVVDGYNPGDPALDGPIGDLPVFMIGWARCVQLGPLTLDLGWIPGRELLGLPEGISWSGVRICFRPLQFGKVRFFSMEVDLDLMAGLMVGIWIARRMMS